MLTRSKPCYTLINMWSGSFRNPLPHPNSANILYQTIAWGWAKSCNSVSLWAGHGKSSRQQDVKRITRPLCLSYLGSSLSATPLCIWNVLFLSRSCFPPKKNMFLQTWQLNVCWVLGYWHAVRSGWRPWLGQRMLRIGAVHGEPPESAALQPHQCFLKAYSHGPWTLQRSKRAASCSSADRYRTNCTLIHLIFSS